MDNKLHKIKVETKAGQLNFENVIEYDFGRIYLFIRTTEKTLSIGRDIIIKAWRWYNHKWTPINITKKIKNKP